MTDQSHFSPATSPTKDATNTSAPKNRLQLLLRFWPGLVVLVVILLLAGLYQFTIKQFKSQVTVDHAQHRQDSPHVHTIVHVKQKLMVGINPSNPPFSFKPSGELAGFDVDLSKAIARELNVPVEFIEYDFDSSLSTTNIGANNPLTEDTVDLVISGVTVNRTRQQYYSFSKPYLSAGLVAVTPSGSTAIQQSSDVQGKALGVVENDSAIDYARTVTEQDRIHTYTSHNAATEALLSGSIEAFIIEAPVAQALVDTNHAIHIATDLLTRDDYAVMVMRGEDDLIDELDTILNLLRQKGVLESLRHKWLE